MFSRFTRCAALAAAVVATLIPGPAAAQQVIPGLFLPPQSLIGNTLPQSGNAVAVSFGQLLTGMAQLTFPPLNTNSITLMGATSGQATVSAQAVAGTPAIKLPNASGTLADSAVSPLVLDPVTGALSCPTCGPTLTATAPIVLNPVTSVISCPTCSTTTPSTSAILVATRTAAIAQDLHTFGVIQTGGYALAGDGGGATFKNVGAGPFQDSVILTGTISNAGSSYTNGTYYAATLSGGTCSTPPEANIVVSGAVISSVTLVNAIGSGCTPGDVLTTSAGNIGGTGSGFTYTVSTVSTPLASFTDSVGTRFQYVPADAFIDVRQFGCVFDWNGTDAGATNNFSCLQAALYFGGRKTPGARIDHGGVAGATVLLPKGTGLVCGSLIVQNSTMFRGQGAFNSSLKLCDSGLAATSHFIQICDSAVHLACFGAKVMDMTLYATTSAAANANISMLYSDNVQQTTAIEHVAVYAGLRNCFQYTNGYGGAAKVNIYDFFCTLFTASSNDGIVINPTTTVNVSFDGGLIVESPSYSANAVNWLSGNLFINGFHTEGIVTGINAAASVSTYQGSLRGATGGSGCTELLKLQSTNTLGNFSIGTSQKNGCTRLVTDGQPSGSNQTTDQVLDKVFNP